MNCIRCQAPMRKQNEASLSMVLDTCISCRGLWFSKDEIKLALGIKSTGKTGAQDGIALRCPSCSNSELFNFRISPEVKMPLVSCPKCMGAWVEGGQLQQLKNQCSGQVKQAISPLYSESVTVSLPVNNPVPQQERDWLSILAVIFLMIGVLAFGYILLKHFGILV